MKQETQSIACALRILFLLYSSTYPSTPPFTHPSITPSAHPSNDTSTHFSTIPFENGKESIDDVEMKKKVQEKLVTLVFF